MSNEPYDRERVTINSDAQLEYLAIIKDTLPAWSGGYFTTGRSNSAITDVVTPGYKSKIARGEIINNPCVYTADTITGGGGNESWDNAGHTYWWTGSGAVSEYYFSADDSQNPWGSCAWPTPNASEQRAKALALSNIDNTQYAFGEDALEIGETLRFLKSPLKSISNLTKVYRTDIQKIRRYKSKYNVGSLKRSARDHTKAYADVWLQYRFAASPLIRSCMDALEAYYSYTPTFPERLTARGFSKDLQENETSWDYTSSGGGRNYTLKRSKELDYHASILYTVSNPLYDWKWKLGFRAKDVPTTLWQVFPLSFMVDRVLDISTFSKGVMNLADPNVRILCASVRKKETSKESYKLNSMWSNVYNGYAQGNTNERTQFEYNRQPWDPSVIDTLPQVTLGRLVDDATKIADLCALIRTRLLD